LYEDSLFEWSGKVIPELQENVSEFSWQFQRYYSKVGGANFQIVFLVITTIFYSNENESCVLMINMAL
jgi:hypothetical protein